MHLGRHRMRSSSQAHPQGCVCAAWLSRILHTACSYPPFRGSCALPGPVCCCPENRGRPTTWGPFQGPLIFGNSQILPTRLGMDVEAKVLKMGTWDCPFCTILVTPQLKVGCLAQLGLDLARPDALISTPTALFLGSPMKQSSTPWKTR